MSTRDLINAIAAGDAIEIENAFNSVMAEKVSVRIDDMRIDVAQNLFSEQAEEIEEETELTLEDYSLEELEDFMMSEEFDELDTQEQGSVLEAIRISSDQDLKAMRNKRTQKWHPTDVQMHRNALAAAAKERRAQNSGKGGGVKGFNADFPKGKSRSNDDLRAQNIKNRFKSKSV